MCGYPWSHEEWEYSQLNYFHIPISWTPSSSKRYKIFFQKIMFVSWLNTRKKRHLVIKIYTFLIHITFSRNAFICIPTETIELSIWLYFTPTFMSRAANWNQTNHQTCLCFFPFSLLPSSFTLFIHFLGKYLTLLIHYYNILYINSSCVFCSAVWIPQQLNSLFLQIQFPSIIVMPLPLLRS